ncbi:sulfatase family protein [Capnocytophaga stomatis]|uniref:sulfatase family protein n=1 Tax=Capnocytophaga stomatis TaxID=1848904 RepID=UPI001AD45187|nr:sulfatase [Capnocytophaga stomatis]GIM49049.1 sulfatase [Capnocytophaga stomatis]
MKKITILFSFFLSLIAWGQQKQPNIVIIISDDHSFQSIGAYNKGETSYTPNIDKLSDQGLTFNKAYVANSICGPSRACILTGKFSHKNGYTDNETSRYNSSQQQFVNLLQQNGYQTAWIGKYHLGRDPKGFDFFKILIGQGHYFNPDFIIEGGKTVREQGYVTDIVEDEAEKWLDNRNTDKPFCLIVGQKATHRTWMPDIQDLGTFENVNFPLPDTFYDDYNGRTPASMQEMTIAKHMAMGYDLKMFPPGEEDKDGNFSRMTPEQRKAYNDFYHAIQADLEKKKLTGNALTEWKFQRYMRDYYATAVSLDRNIGRMMNYLDKNNLSDNTIIIYLSDQGFYMGEHGWYDKRWMYEESFRTPMVIKYPKFIKKGKTTESYVMNVDIAPTLLEMAGVAIPSDIQGESFLPVLKKPCKKVRETVYYHYYENGEHAVSPHFGIKDKRYKIIRYYKRYNGWELYDLKKDPKEMNNIYGQKSSEKITKRMKKILLEEIKKLDDKAALEVFNKN